MTTALNPLYAQPNNRPGFVAMLYPEPGRCGAGCACNDHSTGADGYRWKPGTPTIYDTPGDDPCP